MTEYAIFSDEGHVEGGFYSVAEAEAAIAAGYEADDELTVRACCHDHPMQPSAGCDECEEEGAGDTEASDACEGAAS